MSARASARGWPYFSFTYITGVRDRHFSFARARSRGTITAFSQFDFLKPVNGEICLAIFTRVESVRIKAYSYYRVTVTPRRPTVFGLSTTALRLPVLYFGVSSAGRATTVKCEENRSLLSPECPFRCRRCHPVIARAHRREQPRQAGARDRTRLRAGCHVSLARGYLIDATGARGSFCGPLALAAA